MSILVLFLLLLNASDIFLTPFSKNEMKVKHKTYLIVQYQSRSSMNEPVKLDGNQTMEKGIIKLKANSRSTGKYVKCR